MSSERRGAAVRASGIHHSSFIIHHSRRAFTLVEMLVVAGIIAILLTLSIAALKALTGGVQEGNARTVVKTLLASARADAASTGHVVGVRFEQYQYPPGYTPAPRARRQAEDGATLGVIVYPVSFVPSAAAGLQQLKSLLVPSVVTDQQFKDNVGNLFVAVDGREPVRFPQGVELASFSTVGLTDTQIDDLFNNVHNLTTFTVLFSPGGQVAIRPVFVIQRHNRDSVFYAPIDYPQPDPGNPVPDFMARSTFADVVPMLLPDDMFSVNLMSAAAWMGTPPAFLAGKTSQNSLWLYDQVARRQTPLPWTNYLKGRYAGGRGDVFLQINPYTGQLQKPSG